MNKIETYLVEKVEKQLKIQFDLEDWRKDKITIRCNNKCRLLSHLFHKAGLKDVHCDKEGYFEILTSKYDHDDVMDAFYEIHEHPEWIVEFVEKYINNKFMMETTFKPVEVVSE